MKYLLALLMMVVCGTAASAQSYRTLVSSPTTYYVRTDGNDTACTGLTDAAYVSGSYPQNCSFLTWQQAANTVEALDFNNRSVYIRGGAQSASFSQGMNLFGLVGGGNLYLEPGPSGTTITGSLPGGGAITLGASSDVNVWIGGLTLQATGGGYGTVMVTGGAQLLFERTGPTFGSSTRSADIWLHDNLSMVQITNSTFAISGNQNAFIEVTDNAHAFIEASTINLIGTPHWGAAFVVMTANGSLQYVGNSYSGSATGMKFYLTLNSVLNTEGGGASNLPGSIAGSVSTGGVYDVL